MNANTAPQTKSRTAKAIAMFMVIIVAVVGSIAVTPAAVQAAPSNSASGEVTLAVKALRSSRKVRSDKKTVRVCVVNPGQRRVCRTKVVDAPVPVAAPAAAPAPAEKKAAPAPAPARKTAAPAPAPAAAPGPSAVPLPGEANIVRAKGGVELDAGILMAKINDYRRANGRSALPTNGNVVSGSVAWTYKMADMVAVKHDPALPGGQGENVHGNWGWAASCDAARADLGNISNRIFEAFRNSPSHNQNMLMDNYKNQGAAIICVPDAQSGSRIYVTSRFSLS